MITIAISNFIVRFYLQDVYFNFKVGSNNFFDFVVLHVASLLLPIDLGNLQLVRRFDAFDFFNPKVGYSISVLARNLALLCFSKNYTLGTGYVAPICYVLSSDETVAIRLIVVEAQEVTLK